MMMQGWCTVRDPGTKEDVEPAPARGWGFCWDDPSQINCNRVIHDVTDHRAVAVSLLAEAYCVNKLEDNLKVEQPSVRREEYEDLLGRRKIFCVGQNTTANVNEHPLYETGDGRGRFKEVTDERKRNRLMVSARIFTVACRQSFRVNRSQVRNVGTQVLNPFSACNHWSPTFHYVVFHPDVNLHPTLPFFRRSSRRGRS